MKGRPPKFGREEQSRLILKGLKRCTKCEIVKPVPEFYDRRDGQTKDGLSSQCKACTLKRNLAYRKTDKGREVSLAALSKYAKTTKGKKARKRWDTNHLLQVQAGHAVGHGIEHGRLIRPNQCDQCNHKCTPEGHHWKGYEPEYWFDVQWLCSNCHRKTHSPI